MVAYWSLEVMIRFKGVLVRMKSMVTEEMTY